MEGLNMTKYNGWLIALGLVLYAFGFLIGVGLPLLGVIPVFGDAVSVAGGVVEEFLQFFGLIILVFLGRK
jgi:hypothetical protein